MMRLFNVGKDSSELTDELNAVLQHYECFLGVDLDAWATADIVSVSHILDAELQKRADEQQGRDL